MFAAVLTAWLGVFGHANITTLKDWQPLKTVTDVNSTGPNSVSTSVLNLLRG